MEVDLLLLYLIVGIILIFVVLAMLIWAVVTIARRRSGDSQPERGAKTTDRHPRSDLGENSPELPPPDPGPVWNDGAGPNDTEILRVFRDDSTRTISIEIDGKRYHQLTDIREPQTERLLLQIVDDLRGFTRHIVPAAKTEAQTLNGDSRRLDAGSNQRSAQQKPAAPEPGSQPKRGGALTADTVRDQGSSASPIGGLIERAARISDDSESFDETPSGGAAQPPHDAALAGGVSRPPRSAEEKRDIGTFWGRALSPVNSGGVTGPRPLADELEDIWKGLIENAPEKPDRDVHFRTAMDGSLIIDVDGTSYQNLADITDPVAQHIIRAVIRKWEKE